MGKLAHARLPGYQATARVHSIRDLVWESKYLQLYRAEDRFQVASNWEGYLKLFVIWRGVE